jgi:delta1-piperideine-2-carboxylate reductase
MSDPVSAPAAVTVGADEMRRLLGDAMAALEVDDADAEAAVRHFLAAEERGQGGAERLNQLARALEHGTRVQLRPIAVVQERPAGALIDGGEHLGYAVAERATQLAIEKAKANGIAIVAANHHRYSGVLGHYAELAAAQGLVAVAVSSGNLPVVAPHGAAKPLLSTNPIAFGFPSTDSSIVWDAATSAVSGHLLELAARLGRKLPDGVAVDAGGAPTQSPEEARAGAVLAWGGHRGSGLAVAIQLLGLLAGIDVAPHQAADWEAAFVIIVIDPGRWLNVNGYRQAVSQFAAGVRAAPPRAGFDAVRMPSDGSIGKREHRRAKGFTIPCSELNALRRLAARASG